MMYKPQLGRWPFNGSSETEDEHLITRCHSMSGENGGKISGRPQIGCLLSQSSSWFCSFMGKGNASLGIWLPAMPPACERAFMASSLWDFLASIGKDVGRDICGRPRCNMLLKDEGVSLTVKNKDEEFL